MTRLAVNRTFPELLRRRLRLKRNPPPSIRPAMPRPQRRDCHGRLVARILEHAGVDAVLADASFRPWCSATFIGAQHRLLLRLAGETAFARATELARALPAAEFAIAGHIVADLAIDRVEQTGADSAELEIAVLTVEDW